ncbi:MAG TPA: hypothetical protein VLE21_00475 [Candidatus Nitrosocosmicus sp.]|nr:hypothetical protein [Candidatus Nitrosocosmicus sp.]
MEKVEGWDGFVLWLLITEDEVSKYERDVFPHPLRYFVKDYVYEKMPPVVPTVNQISAKFKTLQKSMRKIMKKRLTFTNAIYVEISCVTKMNMTNILKLVICNFDHRSIQQFYLEIPLYYFVSIPFKLIFINSNKFAPCNLCKITSTNF